MTLIQLFHLHRHSRTRQLHYLLYCSCFPIYSVKKQSESAVCLFHCMNPSYQSTPLTGSSVVLPLVLASFRMHLSYAVVISALKSLPTPPLLSPAQCLQRAGTHSTKQPGLSPEGQTIILPQRRHQHSYDPTSAFYLLSCFTLRLLFLLLHFFCGGCGRCLLVCDTLCCRHVGLFFTIPVQILLS